MSIYKHKHHIIPKHAGGTNDPSNLVELTVEEHAEAHRKLYEEYGRWQDKIAWKTLSGQITKAEAIREVSRLANIGNRNAAGINHRGGRPKGWKLENEESRKKLRESHIGIRWTDDQRRKMKNRIVTDETRRKMSISSKGRKQSEETIQKRIISRTGRKRIIDENGKIRFIKPKL